ncbi:MAG: hypothetical protein WCJ62_10995 [Flavobacterium sp.]
MNKFEIVVGSLQITLNGVIIFVTPKNICAIDVLALSETIPTALIFNKYLSNFTTIFNQPLSNCVDSTNTVFTPTTFIAFAEANLGF